LKNNLLIVHGGGPTAVINASLYGVICEAKRHPEIGKIYGAHFGCKGLLNEDFIDLNDIPESKLKLLLVTPASAIGTSRQPLKADDYVKIVQILKKHNIGYVLFNGGNGTMDTCGKLYNSCKDSRISVAGIPKTVDNDICCLDHCPGYASAAKYLIESIQELAQDLKSMPNHVCIVETMGRNTGWLTASTALARNKIGDAPHLLYYPEVAFDSDRFLNDVKSKYDLLGGVIVVVSEGLKTKDGAPLLTPTFQNGRAVTFGSIAAYLSQLIIERLSIKARYEKPGILGRCSIAFQSQNDREEARALGEVAVKLMVDGKSGFMVGISCNETSSSIIDIPLSSVMLTEKALPPQFIADIGNDVTDDFITWAKAFIDIKKPDFFNL